MDANSERRAVSLHHIVGIAMDNFANKDHFPFPSLSQKSTTNCVSTENATACVIWEI
jgi:hypothetical protein